MCKVNQRPGLLTDECQELGHLPGTRANGGEQGSWRSWLESQTIGHNGGICEDRQKINFSSLSSEPTVILLFLFGRESYTGHYVPDSRYEPHVPH